MERYLVHGKDFFVDLISNSYDIGNWIMGNEVDAIVMRSIVDGNSGEDNSNFDQYRSDLLGCYKALHLHDETDPLQISKVWQEAEAGLSAAQFTLLKELVGKDLDEIVELCSTTMFLD